MPGREPGKGFYSNINSFEVNLGKVGTKLKLYKIT